MNTVIPAPQPHDPTFSTFTVDADNPNAPKPIRCEAVAVPGASPDETGYLINDEHYCLVRVTRPRDAAASMYGHLAIAFAVDAEGRPLLRPNGKAIEASYTAAKAKEMLLDDPTGVSAELRTQALEGAMRELLVEIAVIRANDEAGI